MYDRLFTLSCKRATVYFWNCRKHKELDFQASAAVDDVIDLPRDLDSGEWLIRITMYIELNRTFVTGFTQLLFHLITMQWRCCCDYLSNRTLCNVHGDRTNYTCSHVRVTEWRTRQNNVECFYMESTLWASNHTMTCQYLTRVLKQPAWFLFPSHLFICVMQFNESVRLRRDWREKFLMKS